jgi:hypothetical protein
VDADVDSPAVQCAVCGTPLKPSDEACPACDFARPDAGWPLAVDHERDSLFEIDADPISPVSLQLPRAVPPRISDGRIELGAPPDLPLPADDPTDEDDELLEFGEDSDPIGFTLDSELASAPAPRALRVRVVPVAGDQVDEPDVVVPLQAQPDTPVVPRDRTAALERGAVFASRYRVDELIETHGAYYRYLAVQEPMVRRVHLAVLGDLGGGETQQETEARFLREGALLARHSHPNLGSVVDFGRAPDGTCYVATELIYGFSLRELMQRGPVEPDRLATILLDVARGLAACHDAGVVHRAPWASHVVLETAPGSSEALARLGGYGLGLASANLDDNPPMDLARALAPEVVQGSQTTPASDVYAFGVLAAEALLGHPLFEGEAEAVMRAHVEQAPQGLDAFSGRAASLATIITRCLHKDPAERYAHGGLLVPELEALAGAALRPTAAPAALSWRVLLAAALAGALVPTLLLAGTGAFNLTQGPPEPAPPQEPAPVVMSPDLAEVVDAHTTARVRDEVKDLRSEISALESALTEAIVQAEQAREEEAEQQRLAAERRASRRSQQARRPRVEPVSAVVEPPPPLPEPEPVVAEPEPERIAPAEPVVAEPEVLQTVPEPPPPPPPHPAAASLNGLWLGAVGSRDLAIDLVVSSDGSVGGSARIKRAGVVESAVVSGRVSEVDGAYQLELQVTEGSETTSYSGRVDGGTIQGRVAQGGKTKGRWKVSR